MADAVGHEHEEASAVTTIKITGLAATTVIINPGEAGNIYLFEFPLSLGKSLGSTIKFSDLSAPPAMATNVKLSLDPLSSTLQLSTPGAHASSVDPVATAYQAMAKVADSTSVSGMVPVSTIKAVNSVTSSGASLITTTPVPSSTSTGTTKIVRHTRNLTEMFPGTDGRPPGYDSFNDPTQDNTGPRKKSAGSSTVVDIVVVAITVAVFFCLL